jgi:hypothetical protein
VERYEKAIKPLVTEWGKIEVQGMRPAIGDLQRGENEEGGVPAGMIAGEASAWVDGLKQLRTKMQAVAVPTRLRKAAAKFDQAMVQYIQAAETFQAAAEAPEGPPRDDGIKKGIAFAQEGARLYNEASMVLQAARHRAGLPESSDFPNHPATPS